jgi:hypothetical protein
VDSQEFVLWRGSYCHECVFGRLGPRAPPGIKPVEILKVGGFSWVARVTSLFIIRRSSYKKSFSLQRATNLILTSDTHVPHIIEFLYPFKDKLESIEILIESLKNKYDNIYDIIIII